MSQPSQQRVGSSVTQRAAMAAQRMQSRALAGGGKNQADRLQAEMQRQAGMGISAIDKALRDTEFNVTKKRQEVLEEEHGTWLWLSFNIAEALGRFSIRATRLRMIFDWTFMAQNMPLFGVMMGEEEARQAIDDEEPRARARLKMLERGSAAKCTDAGIAIAEHTGILCVGIDERSSIRRGSEVTLQATSFDAIARLMRAERALIDCAAQAVATMAAASTAGRDGAYALYRDEVTAREALLRNRVVRSWSADVAVAGVEFEGVRALLMAQAEAASAGAALYQRAAAGLEEATRAEEAKAAMAGLAALHCELALRKTESEAAAALRNAAGAAMRELIASQLRATEELHVALAAAIERQRAAELADLQAAMQVGMRLGKFAQECHAEHEAFNRATTNEHAAFLARVCDELAAAHRAELERQREKELAQMTLAFTAQRTMLEVAEEEERVRRDAARIVLLDLEADQRARIIAESQRPLTDYLQQFEALFRRAAVAAHCDARTTLFADGVVGITAAVIGPQCDAAVAAIGAVLEEYYKTRRVHELMQNEAMDRLRIISQCEKSTWELYHLRVVTHEAVTRLHEEKMEALERELAETEYRAPIVMWDTGREGIEGLLALHRAELEARADIGRARVEARVMEIRERVEAQMRTGHRILCALPEAERALFDMHRGHWNDLLELMKRITVELETLTRAETTKEYQFYVDQLHLFERCEAGSIELARAAVEGRMALEVRFLTEQEEYLRHLMVRAEFRKRVTTLLLPAERSERAAMHNEYHIARINAFADVGAMAFTALAEECLEEYTEAIDATIAAVAFERQVLVLSHKEEKKRNKLLSKMQDEANQLECVALQLRESLFREEMMKRFLEEREQLRRLERKQFEDWKRLAVRRVAYQKAVPRTTPQPGKHAQRPPTPGRAVRLPEIESGEAGDAPPARDPPRPPSALSPIVRKNSITSMSALPSPAVLSPLVNGGSPLPRESAVAAPSPQSRHGGGSLSNATSPVMEGSAARALRRINRPTA